MTTPLTSVHGLIVPLITPLVRSAGGLDVDVPHLRHLVSHVIAGGAHTVFTLGNAGLFPYLSMAQKRTVIDTVIGETDGRVPVIVGVTCRSRGETADLARYAESSGAAALVFVPLYGDGDPQEKLGTLLSATSSVHVIVYNNPSIQEGRSVTAGTVAAWAGHPRIAGIKQSDPDFDRYIELAALQTDTFSVFQGCAPHIVETRALEASQTIRGFVCRGFVPVQSNAEPRPFSDYFTGTAGTDDRDIAAIVAELDSIPKTIRRLADMGLLLPDTLDVFTPAAA